MKRRFIVTIALALTFSIALVGILQFFIFRAEQFHLIDQQIESTASILLTSDLTTADLKEFEEAEQIIEDVVGGEKINQFVIVYSRSGKIVYKSSNAELIYDEIPLAEKWQTIEAEGHFIRVLTLPLGAHKAGNHRMLQVGIILDEDLLRWRTVGVNLIASSVIVIFLILLATILLSRSLLAPLKNLAEYLRFIGTQIDIRQTIVNDSLAPHRLMVDRLSTSSDEFGSLVQAAQTLNERIRQNLRTTQVWTAQMAHEMKTPLTILKNQLESVETNLTEDPARRAQAVREAMREVNHLNTLITSFLEWTAAENFSATQSDLHAIRLKVAIDDLVARLSLQFPDRLEFSGESDLTVFAQPGFVQQALSNLLTNSLKYSPEGSRVIVRLLENRLEIEDSGPGVPESVLENLGQPFNYGRVINDGQLVNHGFGLGLAWVFTVCRKYQWQLNFARVDSRTLTTIIFPSTSDE